MLTTKTPIQMELEEAQYSDGLIEGKVVFDLVGSYKKGDFFRAQYEEMKQGHGYLLFKTARRVVQIWLTR